MISMCWASDERSGECNEESSSPLMWFHTQHSNKLMVNIPIPQSRPTSQMLRSCWAIRRGCPRKVGALSEKDRIWPIGDPRLHGPPSSSTPCSPPNVAVDETGTERYHDSIARALSFDVDVSLKRQQCREMPPTNHQIRPVKGSQQHQPDRKRDVAPLEHGVDSNLR